MQICMYIYTGSAHEMYRVMTLGNGFCKRYNIPVHEVSRAPIEEHAASICVFCHAYSNCEVIISRHLVASGTDGCSCLKEALVSLVKGSDTIVDIPGGGGGGGAPRLFRQVEFSTKCSYLTGDRAATKGRIPSSSRN